MTTRFKTILILTFCIFFGLTGVFHAANAQNYEEDKVPDYTLPEILEVQNGKPVSSIEMWENTRRPEILKTFEKLVYGKMPGEKPEMSTTVKAAPFISGNTVGIKKEITMSFSNGSDTMDIDLLLILPDQANVPVFLCLNAFGNHTIHSDDEISIQDKWVPNSAEFDIFNHRATESSRGVRCSRWPVERILKRGYGVATFYAGDVYPDHRGGKEKSVQQLFGAYEHPEGGEWEALTTWAWGLSRSMDYLETDMHVDKERVFVIGHSRRGKAALWAGAQDQRFAAVFSNNSGCGGAALSKREFGETVAVINRQFPHWFCDNFDRFNNAEEKLPIDQHMLIGLIAPRPVYVASAEEDLWADPKGEFLAAYHASKVYELYGLKGIDQQKMPPLNQPIREGYIGYHIRGGGHDISRYDWERYMDFTDRHFKEN